MKPGTHIAVLSRSRQSSPLAPRSLQRSRPLTLIHPLHGERQRANLLVQHHCRRRPPTPLHLQAPRRYP